MDPNPITETVTAMQVIYKATIELYESYFDMLEVAIQKTPTSEVDKLNELHDLAKEGEEALQDDLAVFDKVISMDAESLEGMQDELKIQSIYKKLQK